MQNRSNDSPVLFSGFPIEPPCTAGRSYKRSDTIAAIPQENTQCSVAVILDVTLKDTITTSQENSSCHVFRWFLFLDHPLS